MVSEIPSEQILPIYLKKKSTSTFEGMIKEMMIIQNESNRFFARVHLYSWEGEEEGTMVNRRVLRNTKLKSGRGPIVPGKNRWKTS